MASSESSAWPTSAGSGAAAAAGPEAGAASPGLETSKEIYTYKAPWDVYALAVSNRPGSKYEHRYAIGSYVEEYNNKVQVCMGLAFRWRLSCQQPRMQSTMHSLLQIVQLKDGSVEEGFECLSTFAHPYPCTKIMWAPEKLSQSRDLLATTGDYLRLWHSTDEGDMRLEALLNNNSSSDYCAPLTSADWNTGDHNIIATCSIDTTVTVWDLPVRILLFGLPAPL